jgi:hypothetical protein
VGPSKCLSGVEAFDGYAGITAIIQTPCPAGIFGAQLDNPEPADTAARTSAGQIDPLRDEKRRKL